MKAILEFNLPEDQVDFEMAVHGSDYKHVLWNIDQHLRAQLKYNEKLTQEAHDALQEARDKLYQLASESNVTID